jgi:Secretion system C-terminal sorting domain
MKSNFITPARSIRQYAISFFLIIAFAISTAKAQTFQNVQYDNTYTDYVAAIVVDDASGNLDGYIAVGNLVNPNTSNPAINVARYDRFGNVLWTKLVSDDAVKEYHANDAFPAPYGLSPSNHDNCFGQDPTGVYKCNVVKANYKSDFYVCGYYINKGDLKKMLLIKLNYKGDVIWTRRDIGSYGETYNNEEAVSVEASEVDGDVFVAGTVAAGPASPNKNPHFMAARLNSDGRLYWVNRYKAGDDGGSLLGYIAKQSTLIIDAANKDGSLVICGRSENEAVKLLDHAFVSRVNPDGTEAWRVVSVDDDPIDLTAAEDITFTHDVHKTGNFFLAATGFYNDRGTVGASIYNFELDPAGNQVSSSKLTQTSSPIAQMWGQSITTDNSTDRNYIISGGMNEEKGTPSYVFLLKTDMAQVPFWQYFYPDYSFPNFAATESAYATGQGYFIATNSGAPGIPSALAIATDLNGKISAPCPEKAFKLKYEKTGFSYNAQMVFQPENKACPAPTTDKQVYHLEKLCNDPYAPKNATAAPLVSELTMRVAPNPASSKLTVDISSDAVQSAMVQLYNMEGRLVEQRKVELVKNRNTIQWEIGNLQPGMYLLQTRTANGKTVKQNWVKQ